MIGPYPVFSDNVLERKLRVQVSAQPLAVEAAI
jgi:hypothetical protein